MRPRLAAEARPSAQAGAVVGNLSQASGHEAFRVAEGGERSLAAVGAFHSWRPAPLCVQLANTHKVGNVCAILVYVPPPTRPWMIERGIKCPAADGA